MLTKDLLRTRIAGKNIVLLFADSSNAKLLDMAQRLICIFENGKGSTAEELEERFVRGDKSRHMEGNGLGLSIAKSLVELQHGRMEVVTGGDLFKVTLYFKAIEER